MRPEVKSENIRSEVRPEVKSENIRLEKVRPGKVFVNQSNQSVSLLFLNTTFY